MSGLSRPRGVNVIELHFDKDEWKDVPPALMTAFKNTATNNMSLKRWSEKMESAMLDVQAQNVEQQRRIQQLESNFGKCKMQLQFLFVYVTSLFSRAHRNNADQESKLRRHAEVNGSFISQFCNFFGVSPTVPAGKSYAPGLNATNSRNLTRKASDTIMESGSEDLTFSACFEIWQKQRSEAERHTENMVNSIQDLHIVSDRTRERMIAWRDTMSENAHLMEALSGSATTAHNELQILKAQNVPINSIRSLIQEARGQVEAQVCTVTQSIEDMRKRVDKQDASIEERLSMMHKETQQSLGQHGEEMAGLMKKNIDPMSSYLNAMHVKADAMQEQLDGIDKRLPEMQAQLQAYHRLLEAEHDQHLLDSQTTKELLDELQQSVEQQRKQLQDERRTSITELDNATKQLHERLEDLGSRVQQVREGMQTLEKGRFEKMTHALSTLDQKVAAWISNNALPAKISDARLYTLESRLNEEATRRFKLESRLSTFESASTELDSPTLPSMHNKHRVPEFQSDALGDSVLDPNSSQLPDQSARQEVGVGDLPTKGILPGIEGTERRSPTAASKDSAQSSPSPQMRGPPASGAGPPRWSTKQRTLSLGDSLGRGKRQDRKEQGQANRGLAIQASVPPWSSMQSMQ